MKEINNELCRVLRDMIKKREKSMKMGDKYCGDDNLLGILLKSNEKEIKENGSNAGMNMEQVIEECKTFNFSGQESTSNLLAWTMLMLSVHPTWQQRARDEVFRVFGEAAAPDFDGLNRLKVVSHVHLYITYILSSYFLNVRVKMQFLVLCR